MNLKDFEKEFRQVDESLNVEIQSLLDSFSHLGESEWKDTIDEFLLCDYTPIPLEALKASDEKAQVLSNLELDPRTYKIKGNMDVSSELVHIGHTLSKHYEDLFSISHDESPGISFIYGCGPNLFRLLVYDRKTGETRRALNPVQGVG